MDITTSDIEGAAGTVVAVTGELDVFTAPQLEVALQDQIGQGHADLVVDLSGVEFLDSTGLGVMVKALKWAREAGGGLRVVATQERITKVFTITGLDEVMQLSGSVEG
ncbi:MAG: STAS domain-containing protein [Candidatus Nanopelagicales bacterium]